jgi:hypothetical protein
MNKINELQTYAIVLVGAYTRKNMQCALKNRCIKRSHYLIQDWFNYPEKNKTCRVELELRNKTDLGNFIRPANLFELVRFAILRPSLVLSYGPIDGFDFYMEEMGKEIGVSLTVPFVTYSGGKIEVSLDHNNRRSESSHQLVVIDER